MSIQLILTQGSRAGTAAPIHPGYYLVGRHKECQIRPKSRSVSRRHCLLLHNEDGFGAMDLKSTGGTYVNGQRVEPHRWRVLTDGDELRFGKVAFTVSIKIPALAATESSADASATSAGSTSGSSTDMEAPESWQNFEVAKFLEIEDLAEFENKYGPPPENHTGSASTNSHSIDLTPDRDHALDDSVVGLEDEPNDTFIGRDAEGNSEESQEFDEDKVVEVDSKPKAKPPRRKIDHSQYKKAPRRSFSLPTFGLSPPENVDAKLLGVIAVVVLTLGLFAYQVYQFQSGPDITIRENLD